MRYISELERKVQTLQTEATTMSAQLTMLQVWFYTTLKFELPLRPLFWTELKFGPTLGPYFERFCGLAMVEIIY